jgi:DNA modification methylase
MAETPAAEWLPIDALRAWERNPKVHPEAQIKDLMASIKRFGWGAPILARMDGEVIAGHGRLEAARRLGLTRVPVRRLDLDPADAALLALADNRLTETGSWDDDAVARILAEASSGGLDITGLGWGAKEIDALLASVAPREGLTDPDDVPEKAPPISVLGDLWTLGRHRLICGDSTQADVVARVLGGVRPHLMVTDPPYGVRYDPGWRNDADMAGGKAPGGRAVGKVLNDDRCDWREAWALFPGDVAYVWHAALFGGEVKASLEASGFDVRAQIVWAKDRLVLGRGHYHWQHEPAWYAVRRSATAHWNGDRKQTTLWSIPKPQKSETGHGTQKPVECMARPIENNSSPGQAVYEPFSGSGTTIIAAERTGRSCHAIELDPGYVDVAVRRWQAHTGEAARLEGDGRTFAEVEAARR